MVEALVWDKKGPALREYSLVIVGVVLFNDNEFH